MGNRTKYNEYREALKRELEFQAFAKKHNRKRAVTCYSILDKYKAYKNIKTDFSHVYSVRDLQKGGYWTKEMLRKEFGVRL